MRINYNFPYYQERLSPRQKARLAAEAKNQRPEIVIAGWVIPILRIRSSVLPGQEQNERKLETGA